MELGIGLGSLVVASLGLIYVVVRNVRQADIARRKQIHDLELDAVKKDTRIQYLEAELADCKEERRERRI